MFSSGGTFGETLFDCADAEVENIAVKHTAAINPEVELISIPLLLYPEVLMAA
jgi:hypothetical protein